MTFFTVSLVSLEKETKNSNLIKFQMLSAETSIIHEICRSENDEMKFFLRLRRETSARSLISIIEL